MSSWAAARSGPSASASAWRSRPDHAPLVAHPRQHHVAAEDRGTVSVGIPRKRKTEFRDRAEALLEVVGLKGFGDKFPWQLSGGMLQRANLCRALIHDPALLLLDEPFGALDQFTREELWAILQQLWMDRKPTVILVTHDLREAAYLATRVCVMSARPGRIVADDTVPFARPRTLDMTFEPDFVALTQRLRGLIVDARTGKV